MYNEEYFEYCKRVAEELEQYINGEIIDEETGEELSLYDYFADVLDFEFIINSDSTYKAVKVYVTLGGPTVWIDTYTARVELRWGSDYAAHCLLSDTVNAIDEYFEEYYNSCR